jgi:hypothetical protein
MGPYKIAARRVRYGYAAFSRLNVYTAIPSIQLHKFKTQRLAIYTSILLHNRVYITTSTAPAFGRLNV